MVRNRIKIRFLESGRSMAQVARELGMSKSHMAWMVLGRIRNAQRQRQIAEKLGVSPEWLWGEFCNPELRPPKRKAVAG